MTGGIQLLNSIPGLYLGKRFLKDVEKIILYSLVVRKKRKKKKVLYIFETDTAHAKTALTLYKDKMNWLVLETIGNEHKG